MMADDDVDCGTMMMKANCDGTAATSSLLFLFPLNNASVLMRHMFVEDFLLLRCFFSLFCAFVRPPAPGGLVPSPSRAVSHIECRIVSLTIALKCGVFVFGAAWVVGFVFRSREPWPKIDRGTQPASKTGRQPSPSAWIIHTETERLCALVHHHCRSECAVLPARELVTRHAEMTMGGPFFRILSAA